MRHRYRAFKEICWSAVLGSYDTWDIVWEGGLEGSPLQQRPSNVLDPTVSGCIPSPAPVPISNPQKHRGSPHPSFKVTKLRRRQESAELSLDAVSGGCDPSYDPWQRRKKRRPGYMKYPGRLFSCTDILTRTLPEDCFLKAGWGKSRTGQGPVSPIPDGRTRPTGRGTPAGRRSGR